MRRFHTKSLALKTNVVRTTLLPFLRQYANHPSNLGLRPEDVDRRANILNAWWTGLLELVAGRTNTSLSGTDRPAILEGIAGVMERPEWRLAPSPFCALADRVETDSTRTTHSNASQSSGTSDFLSESVHHNVRNVFTQNLLSQMAFVVGKMSFRNVPASLITFCGKTCAYAFCFCPGVADMLVRLWEPSMDTMKRVLDESRVSRQDRLDSVSDRVAVSFPPTMHSLKFSSLPNMVRTLRRPASPPLGTANLEWSGPWTKRWSGAESELFYVFAKHFHILVTEFLSIEPSPAERMCVPGLLLVQSQVLSNLDATINRHASPEELPAGATSITFDDVLGDADTPAPSPIPPANATRQMAENRLIMLIRDFLSERNVQFRTARRVFAESFGRLLQAAARKTSIYDSNACSTLCDFLEEALNILVRYEQVDPHHAVLDWPFWISVCKRMTASHNTTTDLKLFAFLYGLWPALTAEASRRAMLCLEFLLDPDFFESRFNHWCPMVRTYFMRLLCWRVARHDGDGTSGDFDVVKALADRLYSVWSHHIWLAELAEATGAQPPSTTPCSPAPSRRFIIVRNQEPPVVTGTSPFLSFDGIVQSPMADSDCRSVSTDSLDSQDFGEEDASKKRWGVLRSLLGVRTQKTRSPGPASSKDDAKPSEPANPSSDPAQSADQAADPAKDETPVRPPITSTFRFSLDWNDHRFYPFPPLAHKPQNVPVPHLPYPALLLLREHQLPLASVQPASFGPSQPVGEAAATSRYAGRALAEWALILNECGNFFERRTSEGVESYHWVETPRLEVEVFRRPG